MQFWAGFGAGCGWLFVIDWVFGGLGCCCSATGPAGQQNRLLLGVVLAPRPSRHLTHQARPGEAEGSGTIWNVPGPMGSGRDSHRNIWFSPIVSPQSVKINHLTSFDQRNCLITRGFRPAPATMQFVLFLVILTIFKTAHGMRFPTRVHQQLPQPAFLVSSGLGLLFFV